MAAAAVGGGDALIGGLVKAVVASDVRVRDCRVAEGGDLGEDDGSGLDDTGGEYRFCCMPMQTALFLLKTVEGGADEPSNTRIGT